MTGSARFEAGPYRGLRPFSDSDLDAVLFFGREREQAVLVANLLVARLTVLYGPSGVGKSSLVRAGVVHELRDQIEKEGGNGRVVVYERWAGDPRTGLVAAIEEACGPLGPAAGLADAAAAATRRIGAPLYLVLDQFEEYFLYHGAGPLAVELPELVGRPGLEVNVLISIRDDALSQLDVFKAAIPDLFANVLRLDRLDRAGARTAIVAPLELFGEMTGRRVEIEPELVEEVLDQVAVGGHQGLELEGVGARQGPGGGDRIETPYLQLVLERLWREETEKGSTTLRLSTLRRLGGAEAIVRDHLEGALASLNDRQLDAAAAVLNQLVTPSGKKIAHRPEDLAEYAHLSARRARAGARYAREPAHPAPDRGERLGARALRDLPRRVGRAGRCLALELGGRARATRGGETTPPALAPERRSACGSRHRDRDCRFRSRPAQSRTRRRASGAGARARGRCPCRVAGRRSEGA